MLKVIAVDDEKKALNRFERVIKEEGRVTLVGAFTNAGDALDFVRKTSIDIAFLDIEMPSVNGLELAEQLIREIPSLEVIMVTAYSQYALKAIQAHVIGYLIKPVEIEEIWEQIDYVLRKRLSEPPKMTGKRLEVHCFGPFYCHPAGNEGDPIRFRTAKAEELFALLLHYQGKPVSKELLIEMLWPESEKTKGVNHFHVTCTYVRNALSDKGFEDILLRDRENYRLNLDNLHCDMLQFVASLKTLSEEASALYSAPYFEDKSYEWAAKARGWFENHFAGHQFRLANQYESDGDNKNAMKAISGILYHNPFEEEAVERLITLKMKTGDMASAVRTYREYEERLERELGAEPSESLKELLAGK